MADQVVYFKTQIYRLKHLINVHYLEVPKEVIQKLGGKLKVRLHCTINHSLTFQCGLMALGDGAAYISINAKRIKELGLKEKDEISVMLKKDNSPYGMEMPAELSELFKQDIEGKSRFDLLSPGKQRYIILYVSSVKNTQLRIYRAILLIENLKALPVGKESFREMLGIQK